MLSELRQHIDHQISLLHLFELVVIVDLLRKLVEFAHDDRPVASRIHQLLNNQLELPLNQQLLGQHLRIQILKSRTLIQELAISEYFAVFGICAWRKHDAVDLVALGENRKGRQSVSSIVVGLQTRLILLPLLAILHFLPLFLAFGHLPFRVVDASGFADINICRICRNIVQNDFLRLVD